MHCHLLDLPVELQLKIVQELVRGEYFDTDKESQDEPIKFYLDLIPWSSTCSFFRNLLASDIFKAVTLVNDEESGSSVNAVSKSQHNVHVKELHFIGCPLKSAHSDEVTFPDAEGTLARSVNELLCDLERFPSLEKLSVEFEFNFWNLSWSDAAEITDWMLEDESIGKAAQAKTCAGWLALMSRTYSTLTQNKLPQFKHLELRQFIFKKVSTFSHAAFHDFLGHLEQLTISIYGGDIAGGGMSYTIQNYFLVMTKLDEYFFNHLGKATTLSIKAPKVAPLGLEGINHVSLTLRTDRMPLLTTLKLDNIFVSQDLVDILIVHKDTLEELSLKTCYADPIPHYITERNENRIYWAHIFTSLFSACSEKLRRFALVGCEMPFPSGQELAEEQISEEESKKVRSILQQDPGRMFFAYAYLDGSEETLIYDNKSGF
ncbi:hypothetical protein MMC22_001031 [Lobaria immixta]|nr:hypothetical protein [Lobaria immixta]